MAHLHQRHLSHDYESGAIFSPTIARIAASTARDWSYVDSWLSSKLPPGRPLPSFERNPDTLKALLALAAANEAADEQRSLLARAEAEALKEVYSLEGLNAFFDFLLDMSVIRFYERLVVEVKAISIDSGGWR